MFFKELGPKKCNKVEVVVMDMWPAFRKSTLKEGHAPNATIVCDKFHIMAHLGTAMDKVRRQEYARLTGTDRSYVKAQRYALLSRWKNLTTKGKRGLKLLFKANNRLHTGYHLTESFGQLWDYKHLTWARRFIDNWKDSLRWQRLEPFNKFAEMVKRHWDGMVAYSHLEEKVPLGFVEGFNNMIRALRQRSFGFRDEEYFRLTILTCMLPKW